ncbi:acyltransferase family protein, partial [Aerococcus urinaeequi]|uniref:acyltransferase family protein n=1 Tax=Aerococcus urinaeequi TaxID=51665 RepID=UPI0039BC23E4
MKERQQNFELLRIIAMFMIVIFHAITYCVIEYELPITGLNDLLLTVLRALIYVCVNVFIIITGYFSVNTKQLKLRKVVNTALMPGFFSAILLTMVMVVGIEEFNFWQIIRKLFATLNLNPKTEHSKKSVVSFRVIFMQNFRYTLFELYRREW